MSFSQKFFIQRSFEVVWAVFRVSAHVGRDKVREGLENRAVEYLVLKNATNLMMLEEIIQLATHIGEISATNSQVLLREVENLKNALEDIGADTNVALIPHTEKTPDNAPNVEEIFSKPPTLIADFMDMVKNLPESGNEKDESALLSDKKDSDSMQKSGKNDQKMGEKVWQGLAKTESLAKSGNNEVARKTAPIQASRPVSHTYRVSHKKKRSMGARERRTIILDIVKDRNLCHIKDVTAQFPKVSPRTIRHDIKQMVEHNMLERVGSGGPNSFFRLKN